MAIYFAPSNYFRAYDRNYVKNVYALKQQNDVNGPITELRPNELPETDSVVISAAGGLGQGYYDSLAQDYLNGSITEAEFYNHLEDIYYSLGGWSDEVSDERKQEIFSSIVQKAHNGVLDYYLGLNQEEWEAAGENVNFYYNSDYHYMHEEAKEKYIQGIDALANKLDLKSERQMLGTYADTVNGRMSVMMSGNAGQFASLDEIPPPGTKIALCTARGDDYWASVFYEGKEYKTDIPFSYDTLDYRFSLSELLSGKAIPQELRGFIDNITVANYYIARSNPRSHDDANFYSVNSRILDMISKYEINCLYED